MGQPDLTQPDDRAPHSAWMAYAVSQGMDPVEARGRTRDQLRVCFAPSGGLVGAEPDLERLDQDPEANAARREARRAPEVA